jgi:hypothetical protein
MIKYIKPNDAEGEKYTPPDHNYPSRTIHTREGDAWLGSGPYDHVEVYLDTQRDWLYVLSEDTRLGYWGMEVFDGASLIGDLFCQSEEQLRNVLHTDSGYQGRITQDPRERIRRLSDYATGYEINEREDRRVKREEDA